MALSMYNPQVRQAGHKTRLLEQPQHQGWKLRPSTVDQGLEGMPGHHLLILTNPGNPLGCVYTRKELEALVKVFRRLLVTRSVPGWNTLFSMSSCQSSVQM